MSATEALRDNKRIGLIDNESPLFQQAVDAILELAEEEAVTNGFAHAVAEWAENAQDRCEKLEERVKALEDLAKRHIRLHIKEELSEPTPAPDLERIIDKYILWVNTNPRDALRAFAGELGVE